MSTQVDNCFTEDPDFNPGKLCVTSTYCTRKPWEFSSMKNTRVLAASLVSAAAAGITLSAAFTVPTRSVADAPKIDNTQVKALYSEKCSACHNLPKPEEKNYTRAEWQRTVNTMLTKYHASESIAPNEAAQIVDYLATFAPKTGGKRSADPWATDSIDVWTDTPNMTRVFNFASGSLAGLAPVGSGTPGVAPVWTVAADKTGPDGMVAHVAGPNFHPDRFALLVDRADQGRNVDVRVRFRIDSGKASPAVGIVCGYTDPNNYTVLRCNQNLSDLALIQITSPTHTTVQQTPLVLPVAPVTSPLAAAIPATSPLAAAIPATAPPNPAPLAPGWHTLRLLVKDGQVRGWVDMQKRINTTLPSYAGGKVGLWTQGNTTASFDDWTVDWYDAPKAAPLS
jgi:mono/diheme cytochrome c family protein